jgi:hypothetical protein
MTLTELDNTRSIAERELEALRTHKERIGQLETDRDILLESIVGIAPDALDSLAPDECHHVYKMLKLRVVICQDDTLEISGTFGDNSSICHSKTLQASSASRATPYPGAKPAIRVAP